MKNNIYYPIKLSFLIIIFLSLNITLRSQSRITKENSRQENSSNFETSFLESLSFYKYNQKSLLNFDKKVKDRFFMTNALEKLFPEKLQKQNFSSVAVVDSFVALTTVRFGSDKKEKYSFTYNSQGNWSMSYIEIIENGLWVNQERNTYNYDTEENILSEFSEKWLFDKWNDNWKVIYSYDSDGNIATEINERAFGFPAKLDKEFKHTYTYNSEGNQTKNITEKWDGSQWINFSKNTLAYDSNKNLTLMLTEVWDGSKWLNFFNSTFTYDSNGNSISLIEEIWDIPLGKWFNKSRYINVYDSNGYKTSLTKEQWLLDWTNMSKINFSYDSNGNLISKINEQWTQGQWKKDSKQTYEYDSSENMIHAFSELWLNANWEPEPSGLFFEDNVNSYTIDATEINVYYNTITTDISEIDEIISDFSLSQNYPNPFNPTTTIEYTIPVEINHELSPQHVQLKVYDLLGSKVTTLVNQKQSTGSYKISFNASNLSSGVYFYQLKSGNNIHVKKMTLIR